MSLVVVMVVLALGSLLALGSARTVWLNERLVGTQSDHGRAQLAAEALLRDAQDDIQGLRADGTRCSDAPGQAGCRGALADNRPFFPTAESDVVALASRIGERDCHQGICLPASVTRLDAQTFAAARVLETSTGVPSDRAATYGQFTGTTTRHPLLSGPSAQAWYWVEVFRYDLWGQTAPPDGQSPVPQASRPFVHRINAYVQGHKPGTRVWLRTLFVAPPLAPPLAPTLAPPPPSPP
jgi:type IV pilus assembly protein PilX